MKTKYGEHVKDLHTSDEDSSTSEEEDEDGNVSLYKFFVGYAEEFDTRSTCF